MFAEPKPNRKRFFSKQSAEDLQTEPGSFEYNAPTTAFMSLWIVTDEDKTVTLPYYPDANYGGFIFWGDGSQTYNSYENRTHIYSKAGTYTIIIDGNISYFHFFGYPNERIKLKEILQWGNLTINNTPPTSNFTDDSFGMFNGCSILNLPKVSDTPTITSDSLRCMFRNCNSLTTIKNIENWNVSGVTNFRLMFSQKNYVTFNHNLGNWNINNATSMNSMFAGVNMSVDNYNKTLIGWSATTAQYISNFRIEAYYSGDGATARASLISANFWTIQDLGPLP